MPPTQAPYGLALKHMAQTVDLLAGRVPPPQFVPLHGDFAYRYVEASTPQALVQKLARVASTLKGAWLLMKNGLVQEQGVLQRVLDELHEDITFLSWSLIKQDHTPLHQEYLDAFYQEEFDKPTALNSTQARPMPPRKKIRAYIARMEVQALDPSTATELSRTVNKAYSGYVHAASPHIMDMYGGEPARFHVEGMLGTPRHGEHRDDLWNYFYRSILAYSISAKAFGDDSLFRSIFEFARAFEQTTPDNAPTTSET